MKAGPTVVLDPVASTDQLSLLIMGERSLPVAILSRREVRRLRHQIDRWLEWDRARQGTPRTYQLNAKEICHSCGCNRAKRCACGAKAQKPAGDHV